jgi:hypothetical protein
MISELRCDDASTFYCKLNRSASISFCITDSALAVFSDSFPFATQLTMYTFLTILSFTLSTLSLIPTTLAQTACNGSPSLCSRIYSNVSEIGTHDSAFIGLLPADNQDESITDQLDAGIRFLQSQTHVNPFGTLEMCHTSCYLEDGGSVVSYLETVKAWLDKNPNEVLTLLLTNGDNVDVSMFDAVFTSSGIKKYVFVPETSPDTLGIDDWPTLQDMIDAGTRLVFFLGKVPPYSSPSYSSHPSLTLSPPQTTAPTPKPTPTSSPNSPTSSKPPTTPPIPTSPNAISIAPPTHPPTDACTS